MKLLNTALIGFALAGAAPASPFKVDRAWLIKTCAMMPEYKVVEDYGPAVKAGYWKFSSSRANSAATVLDVWERYGDADPNHLAYVLATARRESTGTFRPIREAEACGEDEGCRERAIGRVLQRRADRRNAKLIAQGKKPLPAKANYGLANTAGRRYYGRGYNQLTGLSTYERAGRKVGVDLVTHPELATDPQISGRILVQGMLEGWFGSGKPLSFYLNNHKIDWVRARDTTNPGSPNASVTASYARDFRACIRPVA